jgi:hypothetical protein
MIFFFYIFPSFCPTHKLLIAYSPGDYCPIETLERSILDSSRVLYLDLHKHEYIRMYKVH